MQPLYTQSDGEAVMDQFRNLRYGERRQIVPGIEICFRNAGHILGSAIVEIWLSEEGHERKIVFSGDLGFVDAPVMPDPERIEQADLVILESTYGDRLHRSAADTLAELGEVFAAAHGAGGNIVIPAFAVSRTQDLLYLMSEHYDEWGIGRYRVFLDSPMAIEATTTYAQFRHLYETELFRPGTNKTRLPNLTMTRTSEESMAINLIDHGAIIVAASGMCTGGRIVHHLRHNLWRDECHIVIVGFQAYGTLGRRLVDGADYVRIFGEEIKVNATVHTIGGLSAHADQAGLMAWYRGFAGSPPVCLVHGEDEARAALAGKLTQETNARVRIPKLGERLEL